MIYEWRCSGCGLEAEHFEHHPDDKGAESYVCACGYSMAPLIGLLGRGLLYFEEGRERTIWNLGHEPVRLSSAKAHKEAMKRAGVGEAGNRMGEKGVWI